MPSAAHIFACMIFPLMDSVFFLLPLFPVNISVSLSLLPSSELSSLWALIDIFPTNLLSYAHINVCCLIRCAGGLEFHSTSLPALLLSSGLFIPPSCALKVKLSPLQKPLRPYLGDPLTPQPLQQPAEEKKRPPLPREEDNRTKVCVCLCVCVRVCVSATKVVYLLPDCLNTCDNIQWGSSTLEYPRDAADAAHCGAEVKPRTAVNEDFPWPNKTGFF